MKTTTEMTKYIEENNKPKLWSRQQITSSPFGMKKKKINLPCEGSPLLFPSLSAEVLPEELQCHPHRHRRHLH